MSHGHNSLYRFRIGGLVGCRLQTSSFDHGSYGVDTKLRCLCFGVFGLFGPVVSFLEALIGVFGVRGLMREDFLLSRVLKSGEEEVSAS